MFNLISYFDLNTWQIFLSFLIPFLIGIFIAWLIWGVFKRRYNLAENERDDLEQKALGLEAKLKECQKLKDDQQEVISILRKQVESFKGSPESRASTNKQLAFAIPQSSFDKLDPNNLQIIEGIGPKMSEFLHGKGISNWTTLSEYDETYIKNLLESEGGKYRIIDPATWPQQAEYAKEGKWDELIEYQKQLTAGKVGPGKVNDSKVEKILMRIGLLKKWKKDDLKAIEGVGPKIEKLLQSADIKTWEDLSKSKITTLGKILENAGSRYQLAEPATWPEQAELASKNDWKTLNLLQDKLKGGKKVDN